MHDSYGPPAAQAPRSYLPIALLWALFVAYGSLVPLEFRPRADAWQAFMDTPWLSLGVGSRADWVANVLLYLVLAWFARLLYPRFVDDLISDHVPRDAINRGLLTFLPNLLMIARRPLEPA